jgi:hypothetical protein
MSKIPALLLAFPLVFGLAPRPAGQTSVVPDTVAVTSGPLTLRALL